MIEKTCDRCNKTKPIKEFSKDKSRRDGYQYQCKVCNKIWAQSKKGKHASDLYNQSKKGRLVRNRYKKTDKGKKTRNKNTRQYTKENPQRIKANKAINHAVENHSFPRITTQTCADCGQQAQHYHHESYAKKDWLNVIPLCAKCHKERHQIGQYTG